MPNFSSVHKLIVHEVGAPYGPLDTSEFEDFEVIHPAECKYEDDYYRCAVAGNIEQCGARWSLHYVGTPITTPGEYAIRAWAETYRGSDYTEYDGGIALVSPDESDAESIAGTVASGQELVQVAQADSVAGTVTQR